MDPKDPRRNDILAKAATTLTEWTEGPEDSGVKYQSQLLRGKVYSEAGRYADALKDLARAAEAKDDASTSLDWVRFQARYQRVVVTMRAAQAGKGDFKAADDELASFNKWIAAQPGAAEAKTSADMLAYRVAWAHAETLKGDEQAKARQAALGILAGIIQAKPAFRELIFEQLAIQISDDRPLDALMPMQALALAWNLAQVPDEPAEAMKDALLRALDAAELVRKNKTATKAEYKEATLVKAVAAGRLKRFAEAAALNLEYVDMAPDDPHAKDMVEQTIANLYQLKKEGSNTADVQALLQRALDLATGKYSDARFLYLRGATLLGQGKYTEAEATFEKITVKDPSYYDARFQIVLCNVQKVGQLAQQGAKPDEQRTGAANLLKSCTDYLDLLSKAPPDVRARAASNIVDLRLIQISTAISPLEDTGAALKGLQDLESEVASLKLELKPEQRAGILRFRVIALSKEGNSQAVAAEIRKLDPKEAPSVIKELVLENQNEIDNIEKAEPQRAEALAATVATLLDQLVQLTKSPKDAYVFRQWRADMLLRAGKPDDSLKLWVDLRKENDQDLANDMGEARAMFAMRKFKESEDYFLRILQKLPPGTDSYWEAYLRVIQSREAQGKDMSDVKNRLKDLKLGDPASFGGKAFKKDFENLAAKYGV
jgi:tetratricopeptide (TPR) repeat protein